jgi:hypothetical protein
MKNQTTIQKQSQLIARGHTSPGWRASLIPLAVAFACFARLIDAQCPQICDNNFNTAIGSGALYSDTTGNDNTAAGQDALINNTTGNENTASGFESLAFNTTGSNNTASGANSLQSNTTGGNNTASGYQALNMNTIGADNVAAGYEALLNNTSGLTNTAVGAFALVNSQTGTGNIAIGFNAGSGVTSGNNNIDIANNGADESSTIRIGSSNQTATFVAGIRGVGIAGGQPVGVSPTGQLGVRASSARFKEAIKPMGDTSEAILDLKPVKFRYNKELDPKGGPQFGLIAEEVAKVAPDLVTLDDQGKPFTVRYDEVNAMLLNEFLKEHRKVESLEQAVVAQEKENEATRAMLKEESAQIQRVSAQLGITRASTRRVAHGAMGSVAFPDVTQAIPPHFELAKTK